MKNELAGFVQRMNDLALNAMHFADQPTANARELVSVAYRAGNLSGVCEGLLHSDHENGSELYAGIVPSLRATAATLEQQLQIASLGKSGNEATPSPDRSTETLSFPETSILLGLSGKNQLPVR